MTVSTETLYRCSQCGCISPWIKGQWIALIMGFGRKYKWWDHEFHLCSEQCCEILKKRSKKKLEAKATNEIIGRTDR
jgi:hypothetical protein